MAWVDAHCHLNEFENIEEIVAEALQEKVSSMVSNAVDYRSMVQTMELAKRFPSVKPSLGLHPSNVLLESDSDREQAIHFLQQHMDEISAIGETGLDFRDAQTPTQKALQIDWFLKQLQIAKKHDKAVGVHSRSARSEVLDCIEQVGAKRVLLHWFFGNQNQLKKAIELDCFVSLGPSVLSESHAQQFAALVPLNRILLETDSPVSFGGRKAKPSWIPKIAEVVAKEQRVSLRDLEESVEKNARDWLGL